MPPAIELPVVVPKTPARIFSAVAFPNVLPVIDIDAAAPETFMPNAAPGFVAAGPAYQFIVVHFRNHMMPA